MKFWTSPNVCFGLTLAGLSVVIGLPILETRWTVAAPPDAARTSGIANRNPPGAAARKAEPAVSAPLLFAKRYAAAKTLFGSDCLSDRDLLKELTAAPELSARNREGKLPPEFDRYSVAGGKPRSTPVPASPVSEETLKGTDVFAALAKLSRLQGLPFRNEPDCRLDKKRAMSLATVSRHVAVVRSTRLSNEEARTLSPTPSPTFNADGKQQARLRAIGANVAAREEYLRRPEYVPGFMQTMQAGPQELRLQLVQQLEAIPGSEASEGLAKLAVFDPLEIVRRTATQQLTKRPASEYLPTLLNALRYPWAPVATHAAIALVALHADQSLDELRRLVSLPSPTAGVINEWTGYERRLVRIEHRQNCVLCHAMSTSNTDLPRGFISPPQLAAYYAPSDDIPMSGPVVRADVTYLRQDFSVDLEPLPERPERYDFVI